MYLLFLEQPESEVYDEEKLQIHACMWAQWALSGGEAANVRVHISSNCSFRTLRADADLGGTSIRG